MTVSIWKSLLLFGLFGFTAAQDLLVLGEGESDTEGRIEEPKTTPPHPIHVHFRPPPFSPKFAEVSLPPPPHPPPTFYDPQPHKLVELGQYDRMFFNNFNVYQQFFQQFFGGWMQTTPATTTTIKIDTTATPAHNQPPPTEER